MGADLRLGGTMFQRTENVLLLPYQPEVLDWWVLQHVPSVSEGGVAQSHDRVSIHFCCELQYGDCMKGPLWVAQWKRHFVWLLFAVVYHLWNSLPFGRASWVLISPAFQGREKLFSQICSIPDSAFCFSANAICLFDSPFSSAVHLKWTNHSSDLVFISWCWFL